MNIMPIIDKLNKPNAVQGDYEQDGLLYCGKCHTPKQTCGADMLAGKLLAIPCECKKAEIEAEKTRQRKQKVEELRMICLPAEEARGHTFETASDEKHIEIARRYVAKWAEMKERNIGLIFWGNTGTGKTFTAHCIANALLDQEIPVKYVPTVSLVAKLMDHNTNRDSYLDGLCKAPLLILDDLGAERDSAYSREQVCAVIDARCESGRPMIVTTNYTVAEMEQTQDHAMQRIFNRLKGCVPVAVVGESRRNQIGAEKLREAKELLGL